MSKPRDYKRINIKTVLRFASSPREYQRLYQKEYRKLESSKEYYRQYRNLQLKLMFVRELLFLRSLRKWERRLSVTKNLVMEELKKT